MSWIDLRSDTVTRPDEEMRQAMAKAEVGDDVYGEDPTVNCLQEVAAELVGKEAALFVPSGTAGNQIALLAHTSRGDEVIVDAEAHIYYYECGGPAVLAGVQLRPVSGLLAGGGVKVLQSALRPPDIHFPPTRLVCLENTFNRGGGTVMTPAVMEEIYDLCRQRGLSVHLDGARIFNAAIALRCDVRRLTRYCDSVMFCLSKGLGAPVGSILAGKSDFIERARRWRKLLGGGMRQAGVLAAAGLVALRHIERLAEDHLKARRLAEALTALPGLDIDPAQVETNIVVARVKGQRTASALVEELKCRGVLCSVFGRDLIRLVTHKDVSQDDIEKAIMAFKAVLT